MVSLPPQPSKMLLLLLPVKVSPNSVPFTPSIEIRVSLPAAPVAMLVVRFTVTAPVTPT